MNEALTQAPTAGEGWKLERASKPTAGDWSMIVIQKVYRCPVGFWMFREVLAGMSDATYSLLCVGG